ncbi:MAG: 4-hydroxybenzoate 3-monooxygenase [Rhizobiales bacterium]|nr:4-hydroxybenzoate 3-monooxygenase [Hyphomicrobiales bacterium]
MRTRVAIIGSGPAGLLVGSILTRAGIDNVIIERRSRDYVLGRIRAGVLEDATVQLLLSLGAGTRMMREGLPHHGFAIQFNGEALRINIDALTNGRSVMVYGQTEVTRDLMDLRADSGAETVFEAENVTLHDFDRGRPYVTWQKDGFARRIECDFVAGCDGYHGVSRASVPAAAIRTFERAYPFGWLGVLADVPPCDPELIYAAHSRGFALCSMRSARRSRYYIQCAADEDVNHWSDQQFWDELRRRLDAKAAANVVMGPSIEKSVAPLRSFVAEPLRFGKLFLAGDAAHIVPPTGAKGLNLAARDAQQLANAIVEFYLQRSTRGIDTYSQSALERIWKVERFSWAMTTMLHRFEHFSPFEQRMQEAEFRQLQTSEAARRVLAESYVGVE